MNSDLLCLVISLERAVDRRTSISASLTSAGIQFEFIAGVDARSVNVLERPDVDGNRVCPKLHRKLTPPELACALAHQLAYKRFLASDAAYCLILEDDAILEPELPQFIAQRCYAGSGIVLLAHRMARVYRHSRKAALTGYAISDGFNSPVCACAYIVSRAAAQALIAANSPVHAVTDWPTDLPPLGLKIVHPEIIRHPPWTSEASLIGDRPKELRLNRSKRLLKPAYWRQKAKKLFTVRVS